MDEEESRKVEEEIAELEKLREEVKSKASEIKEKIEDASDTTSNLELEKLRLQSEHDYVQKQEEDEKKQLIQARNKVADLRKQLADTMNTYEVKVKTGRTSLAEQKQRLESRKKESVTLRAALEKDRKTEGSLSADITAAEEELSEMSGNHERRMNSLKEDHSKNEDKKVSAEKQLVELKEKRQKLHDEYEKLKADYSGEEQAQKMEMEDSERQRKEAENMFIPDISKFLVGYPELKKELDELRNRFESQSSEATHDLENLFLKKHVREKLRSQLDDLKNSKSKVKAVTGEKGELLKSKAEIELYRSIITQIQEYVIQKKSNTEEEREKLDSELGLLQSELLSLGKEWDSITDSGTDLAMKITASMKKSVAKGSDGEFWVNAMNAIDGIIDESLVEKKPDSPIKEEKRVTFSDTNDVREFEPEEEEPDATNGISDDMEGEQLDLDDEFDKMEDAEVDAVPATEPSDEQKIQPNEFPADENLADEKKPTPGGNDDHDIHDVESVAQKDDDIKDESSTDEKVVANDIPSAEPVAQAESKPIVESEVKSDKNEESVPVVEDEKHSVKRDEEKDSTSESEPVAERMDENTAVEDKNDLFDDDDLFNEDMGSFCANPLAAGDSSASPMVAESAPVEEPKSAPTEEIQDENDISQAEKDRLERKRAMEEKKRKIEEWRKARTQEESVPSAPDTETVSLDDSEEKKTSSSVDDGAETEKSESKVEDSKRQQREMLISGQIFTKHGRAGAPHPRLVYCKDDLSCIYWRDPKKSEPRAKEEILASDVLSVLKGKQTKVLSKKKKVDDELCLSVVAAGRSLDLEATSSAQRDTWVALLLAWSQGL